MKTTMTPFVSRLAIIGITAAAGLLLASCGKQESESASAPAATESMPSDSSGAGKDSMQDMPMTEANPPDSSTLVNSPEAQLHMTKGTIQSVDREAGTVKIAHEAVPSLGWPAMTMDFKVSNKEELAGLKEGERVEFQFAEETAGRYAIAAISPQR